MEVGVEDTINQEDITTIIIKEETTITIVEEDLQEEIHRVIILEIMIAEEDQDLDRVLFLVLDLVLRFHNNHLLLLLLNLLLHRNLPLPLNSNNSFPTITEMIALLPLSKTKFLQ